MVPVFCVLLEVSALDLFKFWQALLTFSAWRQMKGTSTTAVLSSSWPSKLTRIAESSIAAHLSLVLRNTTASTTLA